MKKLIAPAAVISALTIALLTGCTTGTTSTLHTSSPTVTSSPASPSVSASSASGTVTPGSTAKVSDILATIPVAAETNASTYERTYFKHWVDDNSTGCDTRVAVLQRDSTTTPVMDGCTVVSGHWVSPYDNKVYTNPSGMDIDHLVPLAEAWRSGAYEWTAATREAYANDLGTTYDLVPVSLGANRSKGDDDPANWMPTDDTCQYLTWWVSVKYRWSLNMDAAEHDKIVSLLSSDCSPTLAAKVPAKASVTADGSATTVPNTVAPAPSKAATTAPAPVTTPSAAAAGEDPKFPTCAAAEAAGYGPYVKGTDPEYAWYRDADGDGTVCEK